MRNKKAAAAVIIHVQAYTACHVGDIGGFAMKKTTLRAGLFLLAAALCATVALAACGGGGATSAPYDSPAGNSADESGSAEGAVSYYTAQDSAAGAAMASESAEAYTDGGEPAGLRLSSRPGEIPLSEKIIYSADAEIETTEFDAAIDRTYAMLDRYGAFIENSYMSGTGDRTAEFTLRVPKDSYSAMTAGLSDIGSVVSFRSNATNISSDYTDTESRLATYRTEEERLLAMLAAVNDVAGMITLESRLSEVRYRIESLTSQLRDWQSRVDYSTLGLYIKEVERLSAQAQPGRTYGAELGEGLAATLRGVGAFFKGLFKFIVVILPVLAILAVAAFAFFRARKLVRARRAKRLEDQKPAERE
jgi:hypothetical protein